MGDYRLKSPAFFDALRDKLAVVDAALKDFDAEIGDCRAADASAWHGRHREASKVLAARLEKEHGARCRDRYDGGRVTLAGVSSTSTSGIVAALRNWRVAAKAKLEAARG